MCFCNEATGTNTDTQASESPFVFAVVVSCTRHHNLCFDNKINDNNSRELITPETSTEVRETRETSPEVEQNCISQFLNCLRGCFLRASDDISSDEDLSSFGSWWNNNATIAQDTTINHDAFQNVRNMLLAIWATDKNCDQSKCSLANCILKIDERLKSGKFTFSTKKGKNRAQNPGVVPLPDLDVIRKYVKVENLTVEQNQVFNSNENMLWINGPAGAGKTVILCGKIIQLLQSDRDSKVVVFKFTGEGNNSQHYQDALHNASIDYKLISTSTRHDHTPAQLADLITGSVCNVIIVELTGRANTTELTDRLTLLSGYHLFVDDIQTVIQYDTTAEMCTVLINNLLDLSANKTVWIACDIVQVWSIMDTKNISIVANLLTDKLTPNQRATLSMNLRNTFDLSIILSVIRDQFVKSCSLKSDILDLVLPAQSPGHFIHGPLTVMHVFNNFNVDSILRVFNIECDRLCVTDLNYSDIGIVYTDYTYDVMSLVEDSVEKRCVNTDSKIAVCHSRDCASAQWPAVIVLCKVSRYSEEQDLTRLYLLLSRARVYCSVFIYPESYETLSDSPFMVRLLDKLSNYARIIRY